MKILIFLFLFLPISSAFSWTLPSGDLEGKDWNSESLKGKTYFLIYVSPKKKDLNEKATEALKEKKFNTSEFASVAIVDLKSSWIPNGLIVGSIKKKQKKYPRTIYLKDKDSFMHKTLDFKPSGNDIFIFNKEGKEIFRHQGKMSENSIKKMISTIESTVK